MKYNAINVPTSNSNNQIFYLKNTKKNLNNSEREEKKTKRAITIVLVIILVIIFFLFFLLLILRLTSRKDNYNNNNNEKEKEEEEEEEKEEEKEKEKEREEEEEKEKEREEELEQENESVINCDIGFILQNNICVDDYSFEAIYSVEDASNPIKLFNLDDTDIEQIISIKINNKEVENKSSEYLFDSPGNYSVKTLLNLSEVSSITKLF